MLKVCKFKILFSSSWDTFNGVDHVDYLAELLRTEGATITKIKVVINVALSEDQETELRELINSMNFGFDGKLELHFNHSHKMYQPFHEQTLSALQNSQ